MICRHCALHFICILQIMTISWGLKSKNSHELGRGQKRSKVTGSLIKVPDIVPWQIKVKVDLLSPDPEILHNIVTEL